MSLAERLARPEIRDLPPVDIAGPPLPGTIRLNANENPYASLAAGQPAINRYPDPQPEQLRQRLADLYGVAASSLEELADEDAAWCSARMALKLLTTSRTRPGAADAPAELVRAAA